MAIKIEETGETKELIIIDPKTGLDWSSDLIDDDNITINSDGDRICSQETFEWWKSLVERYQAADNRYYETLQKVENFEKFMEFMDSAIGVDLENYPEYLNQALDAWEDAE